jgi:hypothetical protein
MMTTNGSTVPRASGPPDPSVNVSLWVKGKAAFVLHQDKAVPTPDLYRPKQAADQQNHSLNHARGELLWLTDVGHQHQPCLILGAGLIKRDMRQHRLRAAGNQPKMHMHMPFGAPHMSAFNNPQATWNQRFAAEQ